MKDEFFLDEVREGFFIPSMMKKTWAVEIRDTYKLIEKCKELNLKCFATFGSLIGVVRHGGFIPWDDDIDMEMTRESFEILKKNVGTEFNDNEYYVNTYDEMKDENLVRKWLQINNVLRHPDQWKDNYGYPFGMMIDIFMVDFTPSDKREMELYTNVLDVTMGLKMKAQALDEYHKKLEEDPDGEHEPCEVDEKEFEEQLKTIEEVLVRKFDRTKKGYDFWIQLVRELETLCGEYKANDPKTDGASKMSYYVQNNSLISPKYYYSDCVEMPFEEGTMPIVIGYDGYMRKWWPDAMRPRMISGAHDYPFYEKMRTGLYDRFKVDILHYSFDRDKYEMVSSLRDEKSDYAAEIVESLGLFPEAHGMIREGYSLEEKREEILDLLAQCQSLAISVGETMERHILNSEAAIEAIEHYCESVFRLYQGLSEYGGGYPEREEDERALAVFEEQMKAFTDNGLIGKKEVVFLCLNPNDWKSLHSLWQEAVSDMGCHVTVIPVPHYYKDFEGNLREDRLHVMEDGYPDEVELTHYEDYNFKVNHPDIVICQSPYDEFSDAISVDPLFYTVNLRQYVDKIVFIPPFVLDDTNCDKQQFRFTLGVFIKNPGVMYADEVIVQSEVMKDTCVDILDQFIIHELEESEKKSEPEDESETKEAEKKEESEEKKDEGSESEPPKTQDVIDWNERIIGLGSPVFDWESRSRILFRDEKTNVYYEKMSGDVCEPTIYDEIFELPEGWIERIRRPDGTMKKVLLYFLGASMLLDHEKEGVDKAKRLLSFMKKQEDDFVVLWRTDINARQILRKNTSVAWSGYRDLVSWFEKENIGILDKDSAYKMLAAVADGYYGDVDRLMSEVRLRRNPVIWEEPGIYPDEDPSGEEFRPWNPDDMVDMESEWSFCEMLEAMKCHVTDKPEDGNAKRIWEYIC